MKKFLSGLYKVILFASAIATIASTYFGWVAYRDAHPSQASITLPSFSIDPASAAIFFGVIAVVLVLLGLIGLRRQRPSPAPQIVIDDVIKKATRSNAENADDAPKQSRTATELQFLRGRWWYAIWARPPFYSYKAKRRLEFIDSWTAYFKEHKLPEPDAPIEDVRAFVVERAVEFVIATQPDAVFVLLKTPHQLELECGARFSPDHLKTIAAANPSPFMPIRELFYHIHPRPFTDTDSKEAVGREVMDQLSAERLAAWGRQIVGTKRLALAPIALHLFRQAKLTYWFLDEGGERSLHIECIATTVGNGTYQFADLHVDREQALAIWSYLPLRDAARMAYEQTRESAVAAAAERFGETPDGVLHYFASSIFLYHPVYAQLAPSTLRELIPPSLRPSLRVLEDCETITPVSGGKPTYVHALVKRSDLDAFVEWARGAKV